MALRATTLAFVLFAGWAQADRGALTLDVGGGGTVLLLSAPFTARSAPLLSTMASGRIGLRYALSDAFEVTLDGTYEPRVTAYHSGVTVDTSHPDFTGPDAGRGLFNGTLTHSVERRALAAGARWIWGSVFRFHVGLDLGWSQRVYDRFDHIDLSASSPRSHGLRIRPLALSSLLFAPVAGLEWAFADKWSVSLMPRLEMLVGPAPLVGVAVPLVLSHSWYL